MSSYEAIPRRTSPPECLIVPRSIDVDEAASVSHGHVEQLGRILPDDNLRPGIKRSLAQLLEDTPIRKDYARTGRKAGPV